MQGFLGLDNTDEVVTLLKNALPQRPLVYPENVKRPGIE